MAGLPLIAALVLYSLPVAAADAYKVQADSATGTYQIDPVHSMVSFTVGHLGVSELVGRFDTISGSFSLDSANSGQARVSVQIPIDSLDTNFAQRNKDLLGPDYFNAKQFPTMSFIGTTLVSGLLLWPILGQLSLQDAAFNWAAVTVLWFGLWAYFDRRSRQNVSSGVTLMVVAVGTAVVSALTASTLLGQLGGALAAGLGGWLLWNLPRPRWLLGHAGTAVTMLTLGNLLLVGRFYSETPLNIAHSGEVRIH